MRKSEPCAKNKVLPGFGFGLGWFGYVIKGYAPRNVSSILIINAVKWHTKHERGYNPVFGLMSSRRGRGSICHSDRHTDEDPTPPR